jgi:broad specificity phosphatase PhoE
MQLGRAQTFVHGPRIPITYGARVFVTPSRRRIYLLRHAEAAYYDDNLVRAADPRQVPLSPLGRVQARKQAAILASIDFDRAICSGLPRTVETARAILGSRETALEIEPQLEEIRGGERPDDVADSDWIAHIANPWAGAEIAGAHFIGGERFSDFSARVPPAFDAIVAQDNWSTLLLVLHGAVNRRLLNHVMGLAFTGGMSIEQDNACINVLDVDTAADGTVSRYLIRAINITGYDLNKSGVTLTTMELSAQRQAAELAGT